MKLELTYLQKCKAVSHVVELILVFIAACITLAIFTQSGETDGRPRWYFVVCILSAPVLIYQLMVPMWSRAERFANVYAFFTLDALFTIFWFSAAICVITWNANGRDQAAAAAKFPSEWPHNCSHFAFGPPAKCELSKATSGFGFILFILFAVSAAMAAYQVVQYRRTGEFPRPTAAYKAATNPEEELANKDNTWSSSTREMDDPFAHEDDDDIHDSRSGYRAGPSYDDEYSALNSSEADHLPHPGRKWDSEDQELDTGLTRQNTDYYRSHTPSALSPTDYEDTSYHGSTNSRTGGYSFSGGGNHHQ